MGLFDFLFGGTPQTKVEVVPDRIWMTSEAKFAGVTREAIDRSKSDTMALLLVAHFPDVLARLESIVNQQAWAVPCQAVLASELSAKLAGSLNLDAAATIDIIVAERHPLPSVDDRLQEFANELPCRCRFSHHLSLDDAVLKVFAGDWIKNVLRQLGMSENEAIESPMVARRIRQAQQKIEGRVFGSLNAESAAQWLKQNCPELFPK